MFGRFKKKIEISKYEVAEDHRIKEEQLPEIAGTPRVEEKPSKIRQNPKETNKPAEAAEDNSSKRAQEYPDITATKKPFIGIKKYSSVSEIRESIDKELAETKSALGIYLRQLDEKRNLAEKTQRLYDIIAKIADKKTSKRKASQIDLNGLEIVLDATVLNEVIAIESVVTSHQKRLMDLQKAREALQTLDKTDDTEGIKYLVLEKERIPEKILLKLS